MKNILYIAPSPSVKGGISSVIKSYLATDLSRLHRIFLVESHVDGPKLRKLAIAVLGMGKTLFCLLSKDIDIVHIHGSDIISSTRKYMYFNLARLFECKIIYHFHGGFFQEHYARVPRFWQRCIQHFFEKSDLVICLSRSWKEAILQIAPESKAVVIPNSVCLPTGTLGHWKNNTITQLTFLGLIGDKKGIFDLLLVVKRLIVNNYAIRLNIGGNGEIAKLMRTIDRLQLHDHVEYLGWIFEVEKDSLLRETDVFILPSYGEGMPMSILEAMSYGIPVVSTRVGGVPELVMEGKTGYLIEPGDLDALYEKIKVLISDKIKRRRLGREARTIVENNHNIDTNIKKILKIYETL